MFISLLFKYKLRWQHIKKSLLEFLPLKRGTRNAGELVLHEPQVNQYNHTQFKIQNNLSTFNCMKAWQTLVIFQGTTPETIQDITFKIIYRISHGISRSHGFQVSEVWHQMIASHLIQLICGKFIHWKPKVIKIQNQVSKALM